MSTTQGLVGERSNPYSVSAYTPFQRLLVLLPNADIHEPQLAQRLWDIASPFHAAIHLICGFDDWSEEPTIRLRLALLTTLLRETGVEITSQLELGVKWVELVRHIYRHGDLVVCMKEHQVPDGIGFRDSSLKPISRYLDILHMSVHEISGAVIPSEPPSRWQFVRTWVLPMAVALIFFVLQIAIINWTRDWSEWAQKTALIASALTELTVIARIAI